jgi:hypothetical protein
MMGFPTVLDIGTSRMTPVQINSAKMGRLPGGLL